MGRTKGGSGAKNGRDSNPKRLGVKCYGGERVTAGSILVKQRGTKIHPGVNVKLGTDDTLYSVVDGVVKYGERRNRKIVSVEPASFEKFRQPDGHLKLVPLASEQESTGAASE